MDIDEKLEILKKERSKVLKRKNVTSKDIKKLDEILKDKVKKLRKQNGKKKNFRNILLEVLGEEIRTLLLQRILDASQNNALTFFVGAGVSRLSNAPSWEELVKEIEKLKNNKKDASRYSNDELLRIPQMFFYSCNNEGEYYESIKNIFPKDLKPNAVHSKLFDWNPASFVTTNFENLLEDEAAERVQFYKKVAKDTDVPNIYGDKYILKVHGDFDNENFVLKEEDYLNFDEKFKLIKTLLISLFSTNTVVFIGYGLGDYNIKLVLNWVKNQLGKDFLNPIFIYTDATPLSDEDFFYYECSGLDVIDCNLLPKSASEVFKKQYMDFFKALKKQSTPESPDENVEQLNNVFFEVLNEQLKKQPTSKSSDDGSKSSDARFKQVCGQFLKALNKQLKKQPTSKSSDDGSKSSDDCFKQVCVKFLEALNKQLKKQPTSKSSNARFKQVCGKFSEALKKQPTSKSSDDGFEQVCEDFLGALKEQLDEFEQRYLAFFDALKEQQTPTLSENSEEKGFNLLYTLLSPLNALQTLRVEDVLESLSYYIKECKKNYDFDNDGYCITFSHNNQLLEKFFEIHISVAKNFPKPQPEDIIKSQPKNILNSLPENILNSLPKKKKFQLKVITKYQHILAVLIKARICEISDNNKKNSASIVMAGKLFEDKDRKWIENCILFNFSGMKEYSKKSYKNSSEHFTKAFYLYQIGDVDKAEKMFIDIARQAFKEEKYLLSYLATLNYRTIWKHGKDRIEKEADVTNLFANFPMTFQNEYKSLIRLHQNNQPFKMILTSLDGVGIQQGGSSVDQNKISEGLFGFKMFLRFWIGNRIITWIGYDSVVRYSIQKKFDLISQQSDGKIELDEIDFYCLVNYILPKEIDALLRSCNARTIEFQNMELILKAAVNLLDWEKKICSQEVDNAPAYKFIGPTYRKKFARKIETCFRILSYVDIESVAPEFICIIEKYDKCLYPKYFISEYY